MDKRVGTFAFSAWEVSLKNKVHLDLAASGQVFELEPAQARTLGTAMCCQ